MTRYTKAIAPIILACTLSHVRDPETERMLWLTKCSDGAKSAYVGRTEKKFKRAKRVATEWIEARRPKFVVSVDELRAEHK